MGIEFGTVTGFEFDDSVFDGADSEINEMFYGPDATPAASLRSRRDEVLRIIHAAGGSDPIVFGSVARGQDSPCADIDLMITFPADADFVNLLNLQDELSELLSATVNITSSSDGGRVVNSIRAEGHPLSP